MSIADVLVSTQGPLPYSITFNSEVEGEVLFFLSGSAWSSSSGTIGVSLLIDGTPVGLAEVTTNEASSHKALVPAMISSKLSYGNHSLTLEVSNAQTITDGNDIFNVTMIY